MFWHLPTAANATHPVAPDHVPPVVGYGFLARIVISLSLSQQGTIVKLHKLHNKRRYIVQVIIVLYLFSQTLAPLKHVPSANAVNPILDHL